jgi:tRNA threonylcarbamoyladenosine biosynthesis protein TsaE
MTGRRMVSEPELVAFGEGLGRQLRPGEVVWLEGDLGAGKTTLVQAVVRGLGAGQGATSPTYGLVHRYQGRRGPVFHIDCYRLSGGDEGRDLDWEGLARGDVLMVEWPERAGPWALPPTRRFRLEYAADPEARWLEELPC